MPSKDKKGTPSAAGERRALTGLLPQYGTAASLILAALRRRELEFVEIAHDANRAVDDIVIGAANRVDAYQVKWGQHPESFTFRSLVAADKNGRTLIRDLLEGWKRLSARYSTKRVVVILYTCHYPSTHDNCRPTGQPPPLTFAQFIDQVWIPAQSGDLTGVHAEPSAWKELIDASGVSDSEFLQFVVDCRLVFGMKPPGDSSDNSRDGVYERDQLRELSQLLMDLAINPQDRHHFDRRELLIRLNWSHFFELRNRHEFSVTPAYEEIEGPANRLNAALDRLPGGYLFVGGSPGSGKSSLLTRTFEQRAAKERWVRYYAFVPGSPEPGNVRGESENFLHDLTTALEDAGVISGKSRSDFDRQQLIARLDAQLQTLGKDYRDRGMRTVLLIDGLDHVPREQRPQSSMLRDLPHPDRVPEGVFVLLGSQTDQLQDIPAAVRAAIAPADRRIAMEPLSPPAVLAVVDRSGLPIPLNDEQCQTVIRLSQGHPLALGLLLNHLRSATDEAATAQILESTEPYADDIDAVYQSYWDEIAPNHALVYLLALLGRLRRHIDIDWLHSSNGHAVMSQLKIRLGHLFLREAESRWFFFHNSFRLFVQRKTATLVAASETANKAELHRELAKQCAIAPASSPWSWERLFHLVEAGEHEGALALATPLYFREQLLSLRPIEAIADDIRHAMKSAKATNNPLALVRLVLCAAEFAQRADGISDADVASLLLRLGKVDIALEHLFDGRELRVSNDRALASSRRLAGIERDSEARRLFELAQPLTARVKSEGVVGQSAHESLTAWVKAAVLFRPLKSILTFIDSVEAEADEFNRASAEVATSRLRADLCYYLARALKELGREDDAASVEARLDTDDPRRGWWFWLQVERWREALSKGDKAKAAKIVRATVAQLPFDSLDNDQRIRIAEALYRAEGATDDVEGFLAILRQPEPVKEYLESGDVLPAFHERFRLNRLLRALGRDGDPVTLVPESSDFEGQGAVYFERAIVRIALIWGDAWRGCFYSAADVWQQAGDLLRLYDRNRRERLRWRSWHSFSVASKDLYSLLIDAVSEHGPEALQILAGMFDEEWRHERRRRDWSTVTRRSVILDLYSAGIDRQWAADQLRLIEPTMLEGQDISGRIQECSEQAEAWARLQQPDDGLVWLKAMLDTSFGVGYRKDYQLENWIEWLPAINDADSAGAPKRFAWFAAASQVLNESTEGRSAHTAAEKLVALAGAWSPRRAVSLLNWFEDHGPVWYDSCTAGLIEVLLEKQGLSTPLAKGAIEFLLRFSKEPRSSLTENYIRLGWKRGAAGVVDGALALYRTISTLPLPASRHRWVSGLRSGLMAVGVDPLPAMPVPTARESGTADSGPERSVTLDDGMILTGQDLEQLASTVDGLVHLATHVKDAYFKWSDYFDRVASDASVPDLRRLASAAAGLRDESLTLAKVSLRQTAAGDRTSAWTTAWKALEASREYGWTRWGDGGTRVEALSALIAADPARGRATAFDAFASDMLRRRSYPSAVVNNLREIVSLLFDQVPVRQVWEEIQSYLTALCPKMETRAQPELGVAPPHDTADRAVVDLLDRHLAGPIHLLAYGAQHGLGELLLEKNADAIAVVRELMNSDDDGKVMAAMGVVEAVAEHGIEYAAPFKGELVGVINHRCFPVWCSARDLLNGLGEQRIAERRRRPLPVIYSLELPEDEAVRHPLRPEPVPGEPLPDPLHWIEALTPFDDDLRWAADVLRRRAMNLLYRARQIMDELYDKEEWSAQAEARLRARLEDADLKFTFQRPRGQVARQAMYCALSELFDAGEMRPDEARFLYESLRPHDPVLLLMRASPRPAEVVPIEGVDSYGHVSHEWVTGFRSAPPRFTANLGDCIVVGEMTELRRLAWELPTVHVRAAVTTRELGPSENLWLRYGLTNVKEYPSLSKRGKTVEHMIVMKRYDGRDSDCAQWIALNPEIARQLGWTLDRNGLFRWADAEGGLMAETIWWKDGSLDHQPPRHDDEVGEGWLVVMSGRGVRQMIARFGPILRTVENRRVLTTEGSQHKESRRASSEVVVS